MSISDSCFLLSTTKAEVVLSFINLSNSQATDIHELRVKPIKFVIDLLVSIKNTRMLSNWNPAPNLF